LTDLKLLEVSSSLDNVLLVQLSFEDKQADMAFCFRWQKHFRK